MEAAPLRDLAGRPDRLCLNMATLGYREPIAVTAARAAAAGFGWITPWRREIDEIQPARDAEAIRSAGLRVHGYGRTSYLAHDSEAARRQAVVAAPEQLQLYGLGYDAAVSGGRRAHLGAAAAELAARLERRIIARRAALELVPGASLNFGFGIPGGIFAVIAEKGIAFSLRMSVEQGVHNGRMLDHALFGAARNADAIVPSIERFDYYSGGGVDIDAPGTLLEHADGSLRVLQPGKVRKLVSRAEHVTFSGAFARARGVFRRGEPGLEVLEVAPGIEIERDILPHMGFAPRIGPVRPMPADCFA